MILNALCDYYQRKKKLGELAPKGYEFRNIPFVIVIDKDGNFIQLMNTRVTPEEAKDGKSDKLYLVPKGVSRSGKFAYKSPNSLWDSEGYVLGVSVFNEKESDEKNEKNQLKANNQHQYFCELVDQIKELDGTGYLDPVQKFLQSDESKRAVTESLEWEEVVKTPSRNFTFKILGEDHLVCESKAAQTWVEKGESQEDPDECIGRCLVTGRRAAIARLHPSIKGVKGTNATGGSVVSFNANPVSSYGFTQGENASVSKEAAYEYGEALNHLLRRHSPNRFVMSDMTMVCWSERSTDLESMIPTNFIFAPKDNPDSGIESLKNAVTNICHQGSSDDSNSQKFYVLGLKGANGRIAIQYWKQTTVLEMSQSIREWLDDVTIGNGIYGDKTPSLYSLLSSMSLFGDIKNIPPSIPTSLIRAIIDRQRIPAIVVKNVLLRIRSERSVSSDNAALLKAYINREIRFKGSSRKELNVGLEKIEDKPAGYKLGALFAYFEKIQSEASGSMVGSSVKDRYYNSFSTKPMVALGALNRLCKSHLSKIKKNKKGLYHYYHREIGKIMDTFEVGGLPKSLGAEEQSYFALGYYQQRESFFKKKSTKANEGED